MGRYKAIIGPCLRARSFSGQKAEAVVGVAALNRMLYAGRPVTGGFVAEGIGGGMMMATGQNG
jgi:hypothetical protein